MDVQVSKSEFKNLYFRYAQPNSGWTEDYWNQLFESREDDEYYFEAPESLLAKRMMISSGQNMHRMFFLTEDAEEAFFQKPGDGGN